jgi:hypothetical protein
MKLVDCVPSNVKVCLIVDGLDEYDGEQDDLSDLFTRLEHSSVVKALISSRPTPTYVAAFDQFASLRLQDLTHDDIGRYVKEKIAANSLMVKLEEIETGASSQLVAGIQSKASSVFLWVVLVTRRLLNGLRNYDTLSDLLKCLDELPTDLEKL